MLFRSLRIGEIVDQITDYEGLALCMVERCVREGGTREVARVANRVSRREECAIENKSSHGMDVSFVAEGSGCIFTDHWITVREYNKDLKVRRTTYVHRT